MLLKDIVRQTVVNSPLPLGAVVLKGESGKTDPHFLIVLRVSEDNFKTLSNTITVLPLLDFIPTEDYPNLWFRLKIDDGNKIPNGNISYFYCEYNFSILSEWHNKILDDMISTDKYTLLFINESYTANSYFHFIINNDTKMEISTEIEACRNGVSLYENLDENKFIRGQGEISKSRSISGEIMNIALVEKQSQLRLRVNPLPKGVEIKFI